MSSRPTDKKVPLPKTDADWKKILTPLQYRVARQKGTEPPFSGEYWTTRKEGAYRCVCCGAILFTSQEKFDSECGWPAFSQPAGAEAIKTQADHSLGMLRTEVICSKCGAHLGHLFDDGPQPNGLRYCINSVSLKLDETKKGKPPAQTPQPAVDQGEK